MAYKNKTLAEVYDWDNEVAGRQIATASLNGMTFFCWWLVQIKGYSNLGCENTLSSSSFAIL